MHSLQRLHHFATVATSPSLSEAARQIGITQPALTASIQKLEGELGFALFDREPKFELSGRGREFLPHARSILAREQDLQREARLLRFGETGDLRVACGPTVADAIMGQALARVMARHPRVNFQTHVGPFAELPSILKGRKIDLFVADYTLLQSEPDFEIIPLPAMEIVFFCRAGHPLARKRAVTADEFFSFPHVGPDLPTWAETWLEKRRPTHLQAGLSLKCSHHALLKSVVLSSDAISGAPLAIIAPEVKFGSLVVLKTRFKPMITKAGVVKIQGRSLGVAAETLIEELNSLQ